MISCDLVPIYEHEGIKSYAVGKTKVGRYHGSMFWNVPGFASKRLIREFKRHVSSFQAPTNLMDSNDPTEVSKRVSKILGEGK